MLKVAITGPDGLVGSRIIELLGQDFAFVPLPQSVLDITDTAAVHEKLSSLKFDIFLHLAAYTNVDGAEKDRELAHKINVEGTKNVFEEVLRRNKKFVYISTDFVFDGENPPYFEDSTPKPFGYYGQTKYEGEQIVKDKAMIVRISYPYRARFDTKPDIVKKIRTMLEQGKELTMITDSLITLTFIDDIAFGLKYLMNNYSTDIYHLVGADSMSPFDVGKLIAKTFDLNGELVKSITYDEYFKDKVGRSRYSEIKSKKNNFHKMKTLEEGLKELAK